MPHTLDRVFLVSVVVSSPIIQKESSISCQSVFTMPTSVESDEHYRFDCLPLCVVCAALEDPRGSNHETFVTGTYIMGGGTSVLQPPAHLPTPARARERFLIHLATSNPKAAVQQGSQPLQTVLKEAIWKADETSDGYASVEQLLKDFGAQGFQVERRHLEDVLWSLAMATQPPTQGSMFDSMDATFAPQLSFNYQALAVFLDTGVLPDGNTPTVRANTPMHTDDDPRMVMHAASPSSMPGHSDVLAQLLELQKLLAEELPLRDAGSAARARQLVQSCLLELQEHPGDKTLDTGREDGRAVEAQRDAVKDEQGDRWQNAGKTKNSREAHVHGAGQVMQEQGVEAESGAAVGTEADGPHASMEGRSSARGEEERRASVDVWLAAKRGDLALLQAHAHKHPHETFRAADNFGNTPLYYSSLCGHVEVCHYLLERAGGHSAVPADEMLRNKTNGLNREVKEVLEGKRALQDVLKDRDERRRAEEEADSELFAGFGMFAALEDEEEEQQLVSEEGQGIEVEEKARGKNEQEGRTGEETNPGEKMRELNKDQGNSGVSKVQEESKVGDAEYFYDF